VSATSTTTEGARDELDECSFERSVEDGVDDRVDHTRRVAQPQEALEDPGVNLTRAAYTHR